MSVKMLAVGPLGVNCYIVEDQGEAAVIDPGGSVPEILKALGTAKVRYILLTHGHYDHTGGAAELLKSCPGAEVYIHEKDFPGPNAAMFPLSSQIGQAKHYGEGDVLRLGSLQFDVLYTPGHSDGGVTLRCGNLLFTGDTLFAGSCGRTDFPGGDYHTLMKSLRRLGELEGDYQVCPGHMDLSRLSIERVQNLYLREAMEEAR